jgi:class 3 adenylate cyclase
MELAGQLDPEQWHAILERFFQILTDGVHRFEGTVNQYTGDGIMALFGAPIAHEDHAQRACYAALHLSDTLKTYADALRIEHGLNFSVRDTDGTARDLAEARRLFAEMGVSGWDDYARSIEA